MKIIKNSRSKSLNFSVKNFHRKMFRSCLELLCLMVWLIYDSIPIPNYKISLQM